MNEKMIDDLNFICNKHKIDPKRLGLVLLAIKKEILHEPILRKNGLEMTEELRLLIDDLNKLGYCEVWYGKK